MAEALGAWQAGHHGVALDLWAPLAQAGVARAQSNMGAAFLQGQGVERDPDKAVAWLQRAADQGDAGAQRNLALCHYEGWGVPQDQALAAAWYEKAAQQDDGDAQDMLSWMKLVGGGCDQDYVGARTLAAPGTGPLACPSPGSSRVACALCISASLLRIRPSPGVSSASVVAQSVSLYNTGFVC